MSSDVNAILGETATLPDVVVRKEHTLQRVRYTHEAMVDMIIAEPWIHQNELARRFGFSASWISTVIASDAFQAALDKRREEIVDPTMRATVKEQLGGLMMRSMEILRAKLDSHHSNVPDQLALRTLELTSRAAGYGARIETNVQVNVTQQIEDAGDQLVHLLRRKKAEVLEGDFTDETP